MVLGFLGPLLVLLVTALFSYRGYTRAVEEAEQGYGRWAVQNNQFAAELAAEKVTGEIGRYFEIAREESEEGRFRPLFFDVLATPALVRLTDPDTPETELATAQTAFRNDAQRQALDRYLQERLNTYQSVAHRDARAPRFASIFVNDRYGTQLAAAFDDESVSQSIGKNWAYRSYFHGRSDEPEPLERPPQNPPHIERTHLSAVFRSTTQKTWKLAISTPIYRVGNGSTFEGILVLTVDLGDFEVSRTRLSAHDQFLVLVDGRTGEDRGTVLHHPLFEQLAAKGQSVPEALLGTEYRVPESVLEGKGEAAYRDPLGSYADQGGLAKAYDRRWLAAASPVLPPIGAGENSESGLVVLVQSDYQSVVQPARQLGQQFMRNSFWMFVVMVTVSLALWYIVVRLFREPRAGLNRAATPVPESTPLHGLSTIAASRRE
jgi:hypothetical protein